MKVMKVKIHESDLERLTSHGILDRKTAEHKSKTMHYGYRSVTYSYEGIEIHSYQQTFGFMVIDDFVQISVTQSLYDKMLKISDELIFEPISWANRYFNDMP